MCLCRCTILLHVEFSSTYGRARYAAMAAAAAVTVGLGLSRWQTAPKDERTKAATNATPEPTVKAELVKSAAQ